MQEKKLYVGNLSYSVTEERLKELFSEYGSITDCVIIKDKYTSRSKGFGFIEFSSKEEADNAIAGLNETEQDGRTIRVNTAHQKERNSDRNSRYNNNY